MQKMWTLFVLVMFSVAAVGQTGHSPSESLPEKHTAPFKHFRAALLIGHTSVPAGEKSDHMFIPSWGLDLEFWFNKYWGLGLHNDLELHSFLVEHGSDEQLEREYPIVMTLDILIKPVKDLVFLAGPGYEFEKTENFALLRMGVEYEFEFGHHWDLSPTIFYDTRKDAFDTWSIALGIGKRF